MYKLIQLCFCLYISINFIQEESLTQFHDRFEHLLWTYEVAKFWMIKLCLNVDLCRNGTSDFPGKSDLQKETNSFFVFLRMASKFLF